MKKLLLMLNLILLLLLASCKQKKYDIVVTLYPQYQIAKEIVGDELTVKLLIAPGADAHHFEPSSKNLIEIINSSLFIYTSNSMEPWVKDTKQNRETYLNLYEEIKLADPDIVDDVHFFMSLDYQIEMVDIILGKVINFSNVDYQKFQNNGKALKQKLISIKENYQTLSGNDYYFIGHNVFDSFHLQTNINFVSLLDEFTDEVNPSSSEIENMFNNLINNNIKVLFYDSISGLKMAENIKKDLLNKNYQITILPIHTFHTVDKETFDKTTSIADLWEENYLNLKEG